MEVRSLALACPGYRFTLAQFSTNDCSTSYPELSGNTIGRVTRPRVFPLRISPISYDRYVDILKPCTALYCFSRCCSGSPTASGSANACDRKMLLTYAPTAAVPPTAEYTRIYGKFIIYLIKRGVKRYLTIVFLFYNDSSRYCSPNHNNRDNRNDNPKRIILFPRFVRSGNKTGIITAGIGVNPAAVPC